jgi:hypothetical protein
MPYRTVNLLPQTYDRLRGYKIAGRSFDDALIELMDRVPVGEYARDALRDLEKRGPSRGRTLFEREMEREWKRLLRERKRAARGRRRRG